MAHTTNNLVLVCVDDGENSLRAFNWYYHNFYRPDHMVGLVYVHAHTPGDSPDYEEKLQDVFEMSVKVIQRFQNLCAQRGVMSQVFTKEKTDSVGNTICKLARDQQASCIVIGERGHGTVKRTIFGSITDHVIHHSHVSVLIVPAPKIRKVSQVTAQKTTRKISLDAGHINGERLQRTLSQPSQDSEQHHENVSVERVRKYSHGSQDARNLRIPKSSSHPKISDIMNEGRARKFSLDSGNMNVGRVRKFSQDSRNVRYDHGDTNIRIRKSSSFSKAIENLSQGRNRKISLDPGNILGRVRKVSQGSKKVSQENINDDRGVRKLSQCSQDGINLRICTSYVSNSHDDDGTKVRVRKVSQV